MFKTNLALKSLLPRLIVLGLVDVFAIQLVGITFNSISPVLGIGIAIFTIIANVVYLDDRLFPWRWVFPALAGMFLLVIYPMGYALATAFTNFGEGHALTKEQAGLAARHPVYAIDCGMKSLAVAELSISNRRFYALTWPVQYSNCYVGVKPTWQPFLGSVPPHLRRSIKLTKHCD